MTSYLRAIFGHGQYNPQQSSSRRSRPRTESLRDAGSSHKRPRTSEGLVVVPPSSATFPAPSHKRSSSLNARGAPISPLRYSFDENTPSRRPSLTRSRHTDHPTMHRRSSSHGHVYHPTVSFSSTYSGSSSSIASGSHRSTRSKAEHRSKAPLRPALKHNSTWHGNVPQAGIYAPSSSDRQIVMHPLLAVSRLSKAAISYDVHYPPSSRTVVDRTTRSAVSDRILVQHATTPPTPSSSRLVLRSHKFPWTVIARGSSTGPKFYLGSGKHHSAITILDVLHAVHDTLMTRVTTEEWEALGRGSRAQRKVAQAYERRCKRMGGGWDGGVRRIDWLGEKSRLVGIDVDKHNPGTAKLVFGRV